VGDALELAKAQKPAGAFNGMDASEDPANQLGVSAALLEFYKIEVQLVEPFVALDKELVDDLTAIG
jgi:hypothetical protein